MTLLPAVVRERGSVLVQRLATQGVTLPEAVQGTLAGLADRRALSRANQERRQKIAEVVFAYWVAVCDHPLAYWTPGRELVLCNLLVLAHDDPSLLLYAIDGVSQDSWVLGVHPKNQRRLESFKWLFEDGGIDRLEHYAETQPAHNKQRPHALVAKYNILVTEIAQ